MTNISHISISSIDELCNFLDWVSLNKAKEVPFKKFSALSGTTQEIKILNNSRYFVSGKIN